MRDKKNALGSSTTRRSLFLWVLLMLLALVTARFLSQRGFQFDD